MVAYFGDWQDLLSIGIACTCAGWVLWATLRPFLRRVANACGMCSACDTTPADGAADELLQIAPPEPQEPHVSV
jgi:hypothetical protein